MGFRTVVMLNNDWCNEWSKDPKLGGKISEAMNYVHNNINSIRFPEPLGQYGRVVECVHADTQSLVRLDGYEGFDAYAYGFRRFGPSTDEDTIDLLKHTADKLGFRLVRKSK